MTERLSRKKKTRGGHRASAQHVIRQINEPIGLEDDIESVCNKLEQYKVVLQEKLDTVKSLDNDILDLIEENELEEEIGLADEFKEKVYKTLFDATKAIQSKRIERTAKTVPPTSGDRVTPPRPSPLDTSSPQPTGESAGTCKVKLPKLTPRKFNGELTKLLMFWDSFESSIHNNQELSGIDRFNYLCILLEGPALEAISGLKLIGANYSEAVAILKKRFGNKKQIIAKHMDTLLNLDTIFPV